MNAYRWLFGLLGAGMFAVLASCSSDVTNDPGWYLVKHDVGHLLDSAQSVDSAKAFMLGAGCRLVHGIPPAGAVLIPAPPAKPQTFDCTSFGRDSTRRIVRSYMARVKGWNPGEHVYSTGYWSYSWGASRSCLHEQGEIRPDTGTVGSYTSVYDQWGDYLGSYYVDHDHPFRYAYDDECAWYTDLDVEWVPAEEGGSAPEDGPPDPYGTGTGGGPMTYQPYVAFIDSIAVSPSSQSTVVGTVTGAFTATAYYDNGSSRTDLPFTWAAVDSTVADKDDDRTFMGIAGGTTAITASYGGKTGAASVGVLIDDSTDLNFSDSTCTRTQLRFCLGHKMNSTKLATFRAALDTSFVRDTGACHDVRTWLINRPDSLLWDGQDWMVAPSGRTTSLGQPWTEGVVTIFNKGWNAYGGVSLTHTAMHEGFHAWVAVDPDRGNTHTEALMDSLAAGCIKAESP